MDLKQIRWGSVDGRDVWLFVLDRGDGMTAQVSNLGGILQSLRVAAADGMRREVVLGYDTMEAYLESDTFFGATIGPIADRLDRGRCVLGGREIRFPLNAPPDAMHSGPIGFHRRVWAWSALSDGVAFGLSFPPEDYGFPGTLDVRVSCRLPRPGTLRLEYSATLSPARSAPCEAAVSFTNHSYFNLSGARRDCLDDVLWVYADRWAETAREEAPICTGRTLPVAGTPFDLRGGARIGDVLSRTDFREIRSGGGIDHYFPVQGSGMRPLAKLFCPESGLEMTCRSDAPGLLVYTGNGLDREPGREGCTYGKNWGVCLETECFPNAVNFPELRGQVLLGPGEVTRTATEFTFSRSDPNHR